MRQALEALIAHGGTKSRVRSLPIWPARKLMEITSVLGLSPLGAYHSLMYAREMFFDVERTKRELGWRSTRSNEAMIIEAYDWYTRNRHAVLSRRGASPHRSPVKRGVLRMLELWP